MRLHNRKYYEPVLLTSYLIAFCLWFVVPALNRPEVLFSLLGGVTAVATFTYSRHLEATRFLKELFVEFNKRYDGLNERLNSLLCLGGEGPLDEKDRQVLVD